MKKLLSVITAVLLLLTPITASGAAVVSMSSSAGAWGETVTLALSLRGTEELSGVCLDIEYDYTKLSYVSFVKGYGLSADYCRVRHLDNGRLRISFTDTQSNYTAVGPVIYLKFLILDGVDGTAVVAPLINEGALFDGDYIELEYSTEEGAVTLLPPFPTAVLDVSEGLVFLDKPYNVDSLSDLLGISVSVEKGEGLVGSGCPLRYMDDLYYTVLRGDTNGDGLIGTSDYLSLKGFLCGGFALPYPFIAACDMDGNGIHSTADAMLHKEALTNSSH